MAALASAGVKRQPTKVTDEMMRDAFLRHQQENVELAESLEHSKRSPPLRGSRLTGVA
jgi:hypothetical protein